MSIQPFHWHKCETCRKRGMRRSMRWVLEPHVRPYDHAKPYVGILLDKVTYSKVVAWHGKIAAEMWDEYVNLKGYSTWHDGECTVL